MSGKLELQRAIHFDHRAKGFVQTDAGSPDDFLPDLMVSWSLKRTRKINGLTLERL